MRSLSILMLIFCGTLSSIGQDIQSIVLTSIKADEPPTKQGQSEYSIIFHRSREILKSTESIIAGQQVKNVNQWRKENKKIFTLPELGVTHEELISVASTEKIELAFDIPKGLALNIDSFLFCQNYKMTKTISTGGFEVSVKLISENKTENIFKFDSNDIGDGGFDLQAYLFCHELFKNVEFPDKVLTDFFSKENLVNTIVYYQSVVECEGFFYKEFVSKNPGRTSKENRMMNGWNFAEYLQNRNTEAEKLRECQGKWKYLELDDELTGEVLFYEQPIVVCGTVSTASVSLIEIEDGSIVRVLSLCNSKNGLSAKNTFNKGDKVKITKAEKPNFKVDLVPYDPKVCELDVAYFGSLSD